MVVPQRILGIFLMRLFAYFYTKPSVCHFRSYVCFCWYTSPLAKKAQCQVGSTSPFMFRGEAGLFLDGGRQACIRTGGSIVSEIQMIALLTSLFGDLTENCSNAIFNWTAEIVSERRERSWHASPGASLQPAGPRRQLQKRRRNRK